MVGATGAVGRELLSVLHDRAFPVGDLRLLASERSAGKRIDTPFGAVAIEEGSSDSFAGVDIAFFSAGGAVSKELVPHAVRAGATVIDNSSAFRMDPDVPLVVPEVNGDALGGDPSVISNPNCSTIVVTVALKPLHDLAVVKRMVVSTYQAASGVGAKGMDALERESRAHLAGEEVEAEVFPFASAERKYPLAFNLIPQVDDFDELGYTKEEWKMVNETQKILADDSIEITVTNVRVPVFRCHAASVNVEVEKDVSIEQVRRAFGVGPGLKLVDEPDRQMYPMPLDVSGEDLVEVGRVRKDNSIARGWNFWVVGDQLLKGAALNAVQIAERLIEIWRRRKRG
jgi:aspartate-semialdehyde dehydrogenase